MRHFCATLCLSILFFYEGTSATDSVVVINPLTFKDSIDLVPNLLWIDTKSGKTTFEQLKSAHFTVNPSNFPNFIIKTNYWFKFSLKNISDSDVLKACLIISECDEIELFAEGFPSILNGENIRYFNRAFRQNYNCLLFSRTLILRVIFE